MLTRANALTALALYWISAVVLLAAALVVMPAAERGEEDGARIGAQLVSILDGVVIRVLDADAGLRLFLLSGEPDDLKPVERARDDLALELEVVRRLAGEDAGVKAAVDALAPEIDAKLAHMATMVERRRADSAAAIAGADYELERTGTRKIRERVDLAIENVLRTLERGNLDEAASEAKRRLAVIGATAAVVLIGLFLTLRLRRSFEAG